MRRDLLNGTLVCENLERKLKKYAIDMDVEIGSVAAGNQS